MRAAWLATAILGAGLVVVSSGCGRGDHLPTYAVTGTVTFPDGKPLEGGTIIFESVDHPVSARSVIDLDGTFTLATYEKGDGAVAGHHRVAIMPPAPRDVDRDERRIRAVIHARYRKFDESGVEFDVSADGPNDFRVEVRRR